MAEGSEEPCSPARLEELASLGEERRRELVAEIARRGYEPGCWIAPADEELLHSAPEARDLLGRVEELPRLEHELGEEFTGEHPWDPPDAGEEGWVVIAQVCDLARDIDVEPFVQLAALRELEDSDLIRNLARKSGRQIPIDPTAKSSLHVVDLRSQALLPKHLLLEHEVRQAIPPDSEFSKRRTRTRFALRVGQRHSRDGIPTALVEELIKPLGEAIEADKALRTRLDAGASELLLHSREDPRRLLLLTPHAAEEPEFAELEDLFLERFLGGLPIELEERLEVDGSKVVPLEDLRAVDFFDSWKLDFDHLTFGSKGDPDSPEPLT